MLNSTGIFLVTVGHGASLVATEKRNCSFKLHVSAHAELVGTGARKVVIIDSYQNLSKIHFLA
jgi:predicted thioesterase